jgi:hypothetical protein
MYRSNILPPSSDLKEYFAILKMVAEGMRAVSIHFEYLENLSHGLDVTWQPVREDLTVHPRTVTLPWG